MPGPYENSARRGGKGGESVKILIVKIGAIGDAAMALSMVEAARAEQPDVHITWLCGRTVEPLLRSYGRIDEIIVADDARLLRGNLWDKVAVLAGVWAKLFLRRFDLVVTGHADSRYAWLSRSALAKERRGFGKDGDRSGPLRGRYHGDEYARLVTDREGPDVPKRRPVRLLPPLKKETQEALEVAPRPWVALAPGGAQNLLRDDALRRWPIGHYVELARRLREKGAGVILTGSESDHWVRRHFEGERVLDLVGQTSLEDLIALYGRCRVVVTHDSGPLHLAALSGAPVLALFGPTTPSEKVEEGGSAVVLWGGEDLSCRPCYDGKNYAACFRNLCLEKIEVERVFREVVELLSRE